MQWCRVVSPIITANICLGPDCIVVDYLKPGTASRSMFFLCLVTCVLQRSCSKSASSTRSLSRFVEIATMLGTLQVYGTFACWYLAISPLYNKRHLLCLMAHQMLRISSRRPSLELLVQRLKCQLPPIRPFLKSLLQPVQTWHHSRKTSCHLPSNHVSSLAVHLQLQARGDTSKCTRINWLAPSYISPKGSRTRPL